MSDGKPGDTTIKTLFAVSGNVCAFHDLQGRVPACEGPLTDPEWKSVKARVCHIAGRKPGSARYDETMTDEERAHFDNLVLMCPTHHVQIDDLEPDRFTVEILHDMKARALEANGPRMGVQQWASDDQLNRYVGMASVAMQRHYAAEEAPMTHDLAVAIEATTMATATVLRSDTSPDAADESVDPSDHRERGLARATGFAHFDENDKRDRYAIQVRQILGYDNVLSVDDSVEPGRLDIATNWLPSDAEFDQLGGLVRANELNVIVTSQGEQRRLP